MQKTRVVIDLTQTTWPIDQAVEAAIRLDPDEIEVVGEPHFGENMEALLQRVRGAGHVVLTGDVCRPPTEGMKVLVLT